MAASPATAEVHNVANEKPGVWGWMLHSRAGLSSYEVSGAAAHSWWSWHSNECILGSSRAAAAYAHVGAWGRRWRYYLAASPFAVLAGTCSAVHRIAGSRRGGPQCIENSNDRVGRIVFGHGPPDPVVDTCAAGDDLHQSFRCNETCHHFVQSSWNHICFNYINIVYLFLKSCGCHLFSPVAADGALRS